MTEPAPLAPPKSQPEMPRWLYGFAIFCVAWLAVTLQFQTSLLEQLVSLGLRLSLADLLLPPAGLIVCYSLIKGHSRWPIWAVPHMHVWLGILSALIVMAMAHSYLIHGYLIPWAFVNKTIGWFVLMAYIFLTGWLVTNLGRDLFYYFIQISCFVFLASQAVSIAGFILIDMEYIKDIALFVYPLDGYMANRNAYGFLMCIVLLFGTIMANRNGSSLLLWTMRAIWLLTPITLMYNGSRAAFLLIILMVVFFLCLRPGFFLKTMSIALLLGCAFIPLTKYSPILQKTQAYGIYGVVHSAPQNDASPKSTLYNNSPTAEIRAADKNRMLVAKDALELWQQNPLIGAGLGTFLVYQESKYGVFIEIIDSAPLWLLTEVGLLGLLAFTGFYTAILLAFWKLWKTKPDQGRAPPTLARTIYAAALFFLVLFAVESLVYQMLYARHLWVVLGFLLAIPVKDALSKRG